MKRLLPFIIPLIVLCAIGCVCAPAAAAEEEAKPWVSPPSPVEAEVSWTVGNHGVPLAPFDSPPSPVEVEMPWTLQRISDADDSEADMTTTEGVSTAATAEEEVKSWVSPRHVLDVPATTAAAAEGEAKPWVPPPSPVEAEMPWALQLISDADDTEVDTTTTEGVPSAATAEEKEKGKEVKPWVPPPSPVEAEVLWTLRGIGDADGSLVDMNTFKGLSTAVNFTWVLLATVLVFIMQAGFGLLGGFLEARHMLNYLCQTFLDTTLAGLVFWIWGFALMFGGSGYLGAEAGNPAIGYSGWILYWGAYDVHTIMLWMFQMVFLTKAVVIPVGAITGRCRFPAYLIHACFIAGIVYPIFGHWVWGGGWLGTLPIGSGALDFAGSGVVHAVGGIMGFVGALLLGPRKGKFNPDGTPNDMPPHNMTYVVLGTFLLYFGWFGFNPGSTLAATDLRVSVIIMNTFLAGAAGAVTAIFVTWSKQGKPNVAWMCNGALGGLVAITAPCAWIPGWASIVIGISASFIMMGSVWLLDWKLKVDDPLGAVSVHGACGLWGLLCVGIFADGSYGGVTGCIVGSGWQLLAQFIAVLVVLAWGLACGAFIWLTMKYTMGIRVSKEAERIGLDHAIHAMDCYPAFHRLMELEKVVYAQQKGKKSRAAK